MVAKLPPVVMCSFWIPATAVEPACDDWISREGGSGGSQQRRGEFRAAIQLRSGLLISQARRRCPSAVRR